MKRGPFRIWLNNIWMANKDEHAEVGEPALPLAVFFQQYKWWLKREYRYHQKQGK